MKLLALDTSTSACSVALFNDGKMTSLHQTAPMQQAKLVLPMIQELLNQSSLTFQELDAIAYGCGPGSFTGIRLTNSVVQALSFAHSLPIIPISTLAAIAQSTYLEKGWKHLLVSLDARMGQIYWGIYVENDKGYVELIDQEYLFEPNSVKIPAIFNREGMEWHGAGDGWNVYETQLTQVLGMAPAEISVDQQPSASAIATLAKIKWDQGEKGIRAEQALPRYLR